jgi:ABC-2 type transport system permease protein
MVLMPVLMTGSIAVQALFQKFEQTKEKKFAVIDRSGGELAKALQAAAEKNNVALASNPDADKESGGMIALEIVRPSVSTPEAIAAQRYELSQQVEGDKLEGIVEIGAKVYDAQDNPSPLSKEKTDDEHSVRFQAKKPTHHQFQSWAEQEINSAIIKHRFVEKKLDPNEIARLQQHVPFKYKALTKRNAEGKFEDTSDSMQIANFLLPGMLIGLMFMLIMVGATPAMQGIVEEKGQRIAEVLLGSVSPFELMAGKLIGVIGVSMTMGTIYLVGGYIVADRYGIAGMLSPELIVTFAVFMILALLIFGSLFIAIGAAAGDIKDTQTLLMPVMLIACLPFFALGPIMQDPNGKVAVICSFFPFATPMILVARQSVPPGVPLWQMVAGVVLVLLTTFVCVWAAGRIFRIGILVQGKGAKFSDIIRWIWRG